MNGDGFIEEIHVPPPLEGQWDALDPALDDRLYPPTREPLVRNIRVATGRWETRKGLLLELVATGSGASRLLDTLYTSGGGRFRLLARGDNAGAVFYDLEVGVDTNFVATSGGTGLGTTTTTQPYFHGSPIGDSYIFTDRFGALRKYVTSGTVAAVVIPTAPTVAPNVKAWVAAVLEAWTGGGTMGWTESASGRFDISDGSSAQSPPMGTGVGHIAIADPAVAGDTITKDVTDEELPSHTIAYWIWGSSISRKWFQFGLGITEPEQFVQPQFVTKAETWWPVYFPVGNLTSINHKRFKCIFSPGTTRNFYFSELFLPGRLEGFYRWVYTHYNPTTGHESGISPVSNGGEALDFSAVGVSHSDGQSGTNAFRKSAMINVTSDSGADATTTKIRIYRSGGVPELTTGPDGRSIWLRVGEINDTSTLLNGAHLAADTTLAVDDEAGFAADDWIVIAKGTVDEEYQQVVSAVADVLTVTPGLESNQADNATVQIAFLDNVGNEAIDVLSTVDEERDTAPSAGHWVQKSPDGRLWIFRYSGQPTGVRVSNRATPLRPRDYECFPDDVDPQTRLNPLQGWSFDIGAEAPGEEIMWGGFWRGLPHILTRNRLYRINAQAQTDWGPNAIQKVLDVGCIAGETVAQDGDYLYWVSEGPRAVRWNGEGPLEVLSHQRVSGRLSLALDSNVNRWFGRTWEGEYGKYYSLWFDFLSGNLGCTSRLDYNVTQNAWEEAFWKQSNGVIHGWQRATLYDGGADDNDLIVANGRGYLYGSDLGADDDGTPIAVNWQTKRFDLGTLGEIREVYVRLAGVSDTLTLTVTTGGSDYGEQEASYSVDLSGTDDVEARVWVARTLKGRWVQLSFSGDVSLRPAIRDIRLWFRPLSPRRYLGG